MIRYKTTDRSEINLLQQVLLQGEALRASMMKTILRNEPTYKENTIENVKALENVGSNAELSVQDKHTCLAYMNGDPMNNDEENRALDTFRSLSGSDICALTSRSFADTQRSCACQTCKAYCKLNLSLRMNPQNKVPPLNLRPTLKKTRNIEANVTSMTKHDNFEVFHYINSLKVALHSFSISSEGKTKLCDAVNCERDKKSSKFSDLTVSYFIEYCLPVGIAKSTKKQSKIDTGLNSVNSVKKCSKHILENVIYFKQIVVHDIENLDIVNFEEIEIILKLTARTLRQRKAVTLGVGKFNFFEFYNSPALSCVNEVEFYLTEDSPIITGSLKVQLQLGCDRLYFGKEFLDSLLHKENKESKSNDDKLNDTFILEDVEPKIPIVEAKKKSPIKKKTTIVTIEKTTNKPLKSNIKNSKTPQGKAGTLSKSTNKTDLNLSESPIEKCILFGFIFVSDVEYQSTYTKTYFTCQPFCQLDFVCSNVTNGGNKVCFNYHQVIPYVYDEDFLFNLRENHMILEFFSSRTTNYSGDEVIGICKIPLHQYYLAFRNPVIIKYLERNKLPVIGTDWHEPIKNVTNSETLGNAQILVALGSEEQIKNLQSERGFTDDIVKRSKHFIPTKNLLSSDQKPEKQTVRRKSLKLAETTCKEKEKTKENSDPENVNIKTPLKKVDKSTLVTPSLSENSNFLRETSKTGEKEMSCSKDVDSRLETIQAYLQQLVALKTESQPAEMEAENETSQNEQSHSLNTNLNNVNMNGSSGGQRPTSSLLETLQGVMNIDLNAKQTFKAQIVVESALHLPARKKCRVRKMKGKVVREELLPSTYVSYEIKDGVVKTTHVVQKTTSPTWNLKHDVFVPVEYLTTANRRLVFKIWRKCNNGSTIPNMQIDTIIGFATVDLTVLRAGLPTIEGWFNIMDFNNKCNGQIKINITPLEDITKYNKQISTTNTSYTTTPKSATVPQPPNQEPSSPDETFSRALKRKFIELEEISQRLKARLHHVTEDLLPENDLGQNDESDDEFEKDINTLCEEDDGSIDFAKEAQDMNLRRVSSSLHQWQQKDTPITQELMITTDQDNNSTENPKISNNQEELALKLTNEDVEVEKSSNLKAFVPEPSVQGPSPSSSSTSTLDRQLHEGKERIDHLLQRLTLLSTQKDVASMPGFSNRFVCGQENVSSSSSSLVNPNLEEDILSELDLEDFDASKLLDSSLENFNGNLEALVGRNFRDAPDGEGNTTESSSDDK